MTQQETIEFIKCARDPLYFLNTYGNAFNIKTQQILMVIYLILQKTLLLD